MSVSHIHWGGGSPTVLRPVDVSRVNRAIRERFDLDDFLEAAVEIDPRTLTEQGARAFARAGVNRASVGVQSFDPAVQLAINRIQSFETTARAVAMLRSEGVPAINFDLIYGLPFQSLQSCLDSVLQALKLRPDRLAVFGYAHVPSFKPHQRKIDPERLPGPAERLNQEQAIADSLTAAGYIRVGLDHFALPGDSLARAAAAGSLRRNFQGYTVDASDALIGFGASAIGRLPHGFVQNATRIPDYERRVSAGRVAVVRGCAVDSEDRRRAAVIEQLMCSYRADIDSLEVQLHPLESDGLIRRSGNSIEVTEEARPLVRAVAAAFDAYLPSGTTKHVTAV
jgi:oxygen-independent coproporphyrinogen-3 oxidase